MALSNDFLLKKIDQVVYRLMNLGATDEDADKKTSADAHKRGIIARDFGIETWDWPQGVGLYGLEKLQTFHGDNRYDDFFQGWVKNNLKTGLPSKNINTSAPYLTLAGLSKRLGNAEYINMCLSHADWLMEGLPKTKEGGFQHVTSAVGDRYGVSLHDGEIWVDTLFMAVLFLNKMGQSENNPAWISEATKQFLIHIKYLYDKKTCLFHHGWTFNGMSNFGGVFWCRGNSWFTYGVIDYLSDCGDNIDPGIKAFLVDTYTAQVDALIKLQAPSGLWRTVLTDPESYEETSGSAAITAGILKGIKMGILDESYKEFADKAVEGICGKVSDDGTVLGVSGGTGIGMDAGHYNNIITAPMAYGQSLTLLALCEALK
ncbi:MAG: glycoside hydrolase family 88/105 protein [Christensenellales bacterium]|jgi:unsaturated rhamnogalacturonyl hydrolase